jgi:ferritin-like metal-binding protein YciE
MADRIGGQERAMADRLATMWDRAVEASLREKGSEDIGEDLVKYLRDAHALEAQALQLLEGGPRIAELDPLAEVFAEHLEQTREHQRLVDERLAAHGARPSRFHAGVMRAQSLNLAGFFKAQPDTPAKLAGFAYAFEALEIGAYELLTRVARRAGDEETAAVAQRIAAEERTAAERVAGTWDAAAEQALRETVGS